MSQHMTSAERAEVEELVAYFKKKGDRAVEQGEPVGPFAKKCRRAAEYLRRLLDAE